MKLNAGLDTGDILLQQEIPIDPGDTSETLAPKLAVVGAVLTVETLRGLQRGSVHPREQDDAQATLAPILKKEDGLINFSRSAIEILNRMRGFQPWPGAYTNFREKNLHVWRASALDQALPVSELRVEGDRLLVGCGDATAIELLELQLEGKKRSSAADFIRGYRPRPGEKLGEKLGV
jgi:methionyl-tRNA formyltransferase